MAAFFSSIEKGRVVIGGVAAPAGESCALTRGFVITVGFSRYSREGERQHAHTQLSHPHHRESTHAQY